MLVNKAENVAKITGMVAERIQNCTKLELSNIVFPKWSDIGLLGQMFRQCLSTKEQPEGNIYDEAQFQTVLRVLGGKLLMSGRPDTYCWKFDKLQKAKDVRPIGCNCADAILNMAEVLNSIESISEKKMLADMFASMNKDLLLVTIAAEERKCVEITRDLYDAGLTQVVDEWMDTDENGMSEATELNVGDYLIVTNDGFYCIRGEEFKTTHSL